MNENWKFSDIPYHRPAVEALQDRYAALPRRASLARRVRASYRAWRASTSGR